MILPYNLQMRNNILKHIAIIMDGNGRWAKKNNLSVSNGHKKGLENAKKIIAKVIELKIEKLTLFAFSSENKYRPELEINSIFSLFLEYLQNEIKQLEDNNIHFKVLGDIALFPNIIQKKIINTEKKLLNQTGLQLNIAAGYGGRWDIVETTKKISKDLLANKIVIDNINEELFSNYSITGANSDVDLLIRTGGEYRISNFLLWNLAYSELFFSDKYWPDFDEQELEKAINNFKERTRRFGRR